MKTAEEILQRYKCPVRVNQYKITVDEVENIIDFRLPDDYKFFLNNFQGFDGIIGQEYIQLWDLESIILINREYRIIDILPNTLGIGGNGSSEFIAIELTKSNKYRIVLSPFIDLDSQYHIEIGKSFTDFLLRLDEGQEWF